VRSELARFGPQSGLAALVDRWPRVVGAAVAASAWPARIARDGTLHVATADSVWAFELGQRAGEIAATLGIAAVRFVPGPLPAAAGGTAAQEAPEPTAGELREAALLAAPLHDENLRKSMQKAISFSLAREGGNRPF
jgi:hypothetical protein